MSISSEITRLQTAKADLKTAIEGKGVTVPSATKIDGYADLVDAISQGSTPTGTKQISVTSNGTQTENVSGYASAQLNVAVPNSYSASDEGKVVSNGALVAQTSDTVTENDTYDTTLIDSLTVNVIGGGGGEEGSFIAAGSTGNVTISVSALYSHILVWDAGITQDDDISSAPYGTRKLILAYADNNTGFFFRGIINTNGTGFTGELSGIGRWGGDTSWTNRAEFTGSTIKLMSLTVGGASVQWIDGRTINWRAW